MDFCRVERISALTPSHKCQVVAADSLLIQASDKARQKLHETAMCLSVIHRVETRLKVTLKGLSLSDCSPEGARFFSCHNLLDLVDMYDINHSVYEKINVSITGQGPRTM